MTSGRKTAGGAPGERHFCHPDTISPVRAERRWRFSAALNVDAIGSAGLATFARGAQNDKGQKQQGEEG